MNTLTLSRIKTLHPNLQALAQRHLELAKEQGIDAEIVQALRTPEAQAALYAEGRTAGGAVVTKAPALHSYHNFGLAYDIVPSAYLALPEWNPNGPLWERLGVIGEGLGLTWGGRWPGATRDLPHFEWKAAPLADLRAYYLKFQKIMPIAVTPTVTALAGLAALAGAYWFFIRPLLQRQGLL